MTRQAKPPLRLISAVQIKGIRLVETAARARISSPREVKEVEAVLGYSARLKEHRKDGTFVVASTMEVRLAPRESNERPAVSIKAGFELTYALPQDFRVSRSELNAFAQTNGIFNVWPYWREFVQNMFVRMALPPFTLPVYRLFEPTKAAPKKGNVAKGASLADATRSGSVETRTE